MVAIIAKLTAKPGKREELKKAFASIQAGVRENEKSTALIYEIFVSRDNHDVFWVLEHFVTDDALAEHTKRDYSAKGGVAMQSLLACEPEAHIADVIKS